MSIRSSSTPHPRSRALRWTYFLCAAEFLIVIPAVMGVATGEIGAVVFGVWLFSLSTGLGALGVGWTGLLPRGRALSRVENRALWILLFATTAAGGAAMLAFLASSRTSSWILIAGVAPAVVLDVMALAVLLRPSSPESEPAAAAVSACLYKRGSTGADC